MTEPLVLAMRRHVTKARLAIAWRVLCSCENQQHRASGLNLVVTAIILWKTWRTSPRSVGSTST
jgi:hypothetical protein